MDEGSKRKWQRRSREEWRAVIERFSASGLGAAAFCASEGISKASLTRWRGLLAEGMATDKQPQPMTHELGSGGFVDAGLLRLAGEGRLELRLDLGGGVLLTLSRG